MTDQTTHKINSKSKSSTPVKVVGGLPKHWEVKKLGEICGIVYGKGLPLKELKSSGFPVFGANGIIGFNDKYLFEEPQVLISCRGAASGKINLSPPNCYVTNNSLVLDIKEKNDLDRTYLFYALSIAKKTKLVTGTAQPQVTINNAIELDISFPPLPEQQAIVAKIEELLSELDNGKQQLLTAQKQLKVYRQSLLKWAFEGKLCQNYDTPDLHDEHDKINHQENQGNQKNHSSDNGEIPKGWNKIKLGDVANAVDPQPSHRTPPIVPNGIPFVSIKDFDSELDKINLTYARKVSPEVLKEHLSRYTLQDGDFVIGKIGTIGKPVRVILPQNYSLSANIVLIQPRKLNPTYLYYFFQSNQIEKAFKAGTNSTTQAAFGIQKVRELQIDVPNEKEQQLIVSELESKLTICDKIEETISQSLLQAEILRQSILKQAFDGRLVKY